MKYLLTTQMGKEYVVKKVLEEKAMNVKAKPNGFPGLLIVEGKKKEIEGILEVEKIMKIIAEGKNFDELLSSLAKRSLPKEIWIEIKKRGRVAEKISTILDALLPILKKKKVKTKINAKKVLIIHAMRGLWLATLSERDIFLKKFRGKPNTKDFTKKIILFQLVYESPEKDWLYYMGQAFGRSCQAFEIKKGVVGFVGSTNYENMLYFLRGVEEGIRSRYELLKRTEGCKRKVPIEVSEVYSFVYSLNKRKTLIIVFDPRGKPINEIKTKIVGKMKEKEEVVLMMGSDRGIPPGIFRYVDFVVDVSPGIVFATEQAPPIALASVISLFLEEKKKRRKI